jgi:hypothetical protein
VRPGATRFGCGQVRPGANLVRARAGVTGWAPGTRGRMSSTNHQANVWVTDAWAGRCRAAHELALFAEVQDGIGVGADPGVGAAPLRDPDVAVRRDVHRAGRSPTSGARQLSLDPYVGRNGFDVADCASMPRPTRLTPYLPYLPYPPYPPYTTESGLPSLTRT